MSLYRLLTAGKALTSLRDEPSSYQMRRKALLPKFGTGGDPFASAKAPTQPAGETRPEAKQAAHASSWPTAWLSKWLGEKPRTAGGFRPQSTRGVGKANHTPPTPVQAELSLDNVKVVRNHLHDADVDLVARGSGSTGLLLGSVAAQRAENALDRLADRIVGVERR
jgi:hypothetical protein